MCSPLVRTGLGISVSVGHGGRVSMKEKWESALKIVREHSTDSAIFFTCDKESTLLLELRMGLDIPVLFVDTGLYQDEIYQYLKTAEEHWKFKTVILKNEKVIGESSASGKEDCYVLLRDKIILPYLLEKGIKTLIEPLKWDERLKKDRVIRVFPLSGFSDLDVWRVIKDRGIPYCELYNKGFRDVGCEPCSASKKQEDVDREEVQRRLKALGYL